MDPSYPSKKNGETFLRYSVVQIWLTFNIINIPTDAHRNIWACVQNLSYAFVDQVNISETAVFEWFVSLSEDANVF